MKTNFIIDDINDINWADKKIGMVDWIHLGDYQHAEKIFDQLKKLNIDYFRTGISWADYLQVDGKKWYEWLLPRLCRLVEVLPCFLYTPPSLGIYPKTSSPLKNPKDYADFIDYFLSHHDDQHHFHWIELWNEPNNKAEYDYTLDSSFDSFCSMIGGAAYWVKHLGRKTVLGGMSPVDPNWLQMVYEKGVMDHIDVVGIHGFPYTFDSVWNGWKDPIGLIRDVIERNKGKQSLWITEVGFSTWQNDERQQVKEFLNAHATTADRIYWYGLFDLSPHYPTVAGLHLDEREYFFGIIGSDDIHKKFLYHLIKDKSFGLTKNHVWMYQSTQEQFSAKEIIILIGGGSSLGVELSQYYLENNFDIGIIDQITSYEMFTRLKEIDSQKVCIENIDINNKWLFQHTLSRFKQKSHIKIIYYLVPIGTRTRNNDSVEMKKFSKMIEGTDHLFTIVKNFSHCSTIVFVVMKLHAWETAFFHYLVKTINLPIMIVQISSIKSKSKNEIIHFLYDINLNYDRYKDIKEILYESSSDH